MPPKKYKTEDEKKAAYALAKKLKRAAEKLANDQKNDENTKQQFISEIVLILVNDIPQKAEALKARKISNAKSQSVKRSAVKEGANIMPKRQKYAK